MFLLFLMVAHDFYRIDWRWSHRISTAGVAGGLTVESLFDVFLVSTTLHFQMVDLCIDFS
jgi:hypothetical protein